VKRSVRVRGVGASLVLALAIGGTARAAIVVDQSDIPLTGVVDTGAPSPNHFANGGSPVQGTRLGQSFSVGQTGALSEIDLALFKILVNDAPAADVQFDVRDTSNRVLFSTDIAGSAISLFGFGTTLWEQAPRVDVSAANLQVTAGEELWFTVAPIPGAFGVAPVLFDSAGGSVITYPTGELFNFTTGGAPVFGSTGDYGFRTFVNVPDVIPPVVPPGGGTEPGDNNGLDAVPEPAQWALMLLGFGGAGVMLRRNRARAAVA
jgi:hypothetical protein